MSALEEIAWLFLLIAVLCALIVVLDLCLRPLRGAWVTNVIWPLAALWAGPIGLILYCFLGRAGESPRTVSWAPKALNTFYCGAGCLVGYVVAEAIIPFVPPVSGSLLLARWTVEAACAFVFGIGFLHVAVRSVTSGSVTSGGFWPSLSSALKAGALPLIAWQVGTMGGMAAARFLVFRYPLASTDPVFWWMMQISMGLAFWVAYPVSFLLLPTEAETESSETPIFAPLHPST